MSRRFSTKSSARGNVKAEEDRVQEGRSRGNLDEITVAEINQQLPDLKGIRRKSSNLLPDMIAGAFKSDSQIPLAAVPIFEAVTTLNQARYALYEALAHKHWHLHQSNQPDKRVASFYARFYMDDAALRLYAAGEHAASSILAMLEVEQTLYVKYKERGSSRATAVGKLLLKEYPDHAITKSVAQLLKNKGWNECMKYRGKWVHDQPPLLEEVGSSFRRGNRWKEKNEGTWELNIGMGDEPDYTIDDLVAFIQPALVNFAALMQDIIDFYIQVLEAKGLTGWISGK